MRISRFFLPVAMSASVFSGAQALAQDIAPPLPAELLLSDADFIESGKCRVLSALTVGVFENGPDDKFKPFFQNMAMEISASADAPFTQKLKAHAPLSDEQTESLNIRILEEIEAEGVKAKQAKSAFISALALHRSCTKFESDFTFKAAPAMLDELRVRKEEDLNAKPKQQEQLPAPALNVT